jgi:copper chaperone CopZ
MAALLHIDALRQHAVPLTLSLPIVAHDIPGRLRAVLPCLRDNASAASARRAALLAIRGVTSVRVNLVTGSVTVLYETGAAARTRLLAALGCQGQPPITPARGSALVGMLTDAVAEHLAKAAVHALMAALI